MLGFGGVPIYDRPDIQSNLLLVARPSGCLEPFDSSDMPSD
jgi:hypothetical protein